MPSTLEWIVASILPLQLTFLSIYLLSPNDDDDGDDNGGGHVNIAHHTIDADTSSISTSTTSGSASGSTYLLHFLLYLFLDASFGNLFHLILLVPARWLACRLPGAVVPPSDHERAWMEQEEQSNDETLLWPALGSLNHLSEEWIVGNNNSIKDDDDDDDDGDGNTAKENTAISTSDGKKSSNLRLRRRRQRHSLDDSQQSQSTQTTAISIQQQTKQGKQPTHIMNQTQQSPQTQPYYLHHARGSTRIRHASQRIGAAIGSLVATYIICTISPLVSMEDVGLFPYYSSSSSSSVFTASTHDFYEEAANINNNNHHIILADLLHGFLIGSSIILLLFLTELSLGWITIIGYFETMEPNENFTLNFLWDVLFHVGVAINEEIMLRGWMFLLGARGIFASFTSSIQWLLGSHHYHYLFVTPTTLATIATVASIVMQSTLFSLLHLYSPGSTSYISLINLFFGGIAASLNIMAATTTTTTIAKVPPLSSSSSIYLGIGWHFGWNITMGHILGRSTSGIPISCACLNVIPKPGLEKWHGGSFGPEQGVLVFGAYLLGMAMVLWVYNGWEGMGLWRDALISSVGAGKLP